MQEDRRFRKNRYTNKDGVQCKWCPKCMLNISLEKFYKSVSNKDGLSDYCGQCASLAVKESAERKAKGEKSKLNIANYVEGVLSKECSLCKKVKSVSEYKWSIGNKTWRSLCNECFQFKYTTSYRIVEKAAGCKFGSIRHNALRAKREWTLDKQTYFKIVESNCEYCGRFYNSPYGSDLDRIDNTRGYHADNVLKCCDYCNNARSNHFTVLEMKNTIGPAIRKVMQSRYWSAFSESKFFKEAAIGSTLACE